MPKFKVYVLDGETGKVVEDVADGTFSDQDEQAAAFLREAQAESDIHEVRHMIAGLNGVLADESITREQAAVIVTLAVTDLIREMRNWVDELDLSETDMAMVLESGREFVAEIGKDLDGVARLLVGATDGRSSNLN